MADLRRDLGESIRQTPQLTWLLLTTCIENPRHMATEMGIAGLNNLWLGTTLEDQDAVDTRMPELAKCRDLSPVLFASCEPLLESLDLTSWLGLEEDRDGSLRRESKYGGQTHVLDWVIAGGACNVAWLRSLRDQCREAEVPLFCKQLRVQEFPNTEGIQCYPT